MVILVACALSACSQTGEEYICYDSRAGVALEAVSQVDFFSGEVTGFEATDLNGLTVEISQANSHLYDCTAQAELEAARQEWWEENKERCGKEQAEIAAMSTQTEAELRLKEAKERLHRRVCEAP